MKKMIAVLGLVALVACSGQTVTGPTPVPDSGTITPNSGTVSQPAPAPVGVPNAGTPSFEGKILAFAGWDVKNTSGNISQMTAYYTSFDNQSLSLGSKTYTVQTGDSFRDTFNKTCVQVDLTYGAPGDAPFLFGYIDDKGNVVGRITDDIRKACTPVRVPDPEPTPSPSPTPPPPCVPEYTKTSTSTSAWPSIGYDGESCGQQIVTTTTTTTNSCTEQSVVSVVKTDGKFLECSTCETKNKPEFKVQSEEHNKNSIKWNVHVENKGVWVLKMYATSSISEYNANTPDYTKDTDDKTLQCKGQGELKVEYGWKGHSSEYWWIVLTRDGVVVHKSAYIINTEN